MRLLYCSLVLALASWVRSDGPVFMDLSDPAGSVSKAKVHLKMMGNVESFSGFIPLKQDRSKALFYWYFPAMKAPEYAPVIVWLQGWSTPSLYGLFLENGPFKVSPFDGLTKRTYAWTRFAHMVYIDSPVGTGFSYANNQSDYPTNSSAVVSDLFTALQNLVQFFPEFQLNDMYVGGESYAGKYAPLLVSRIHNESKLKLKGIFLGNPFVDPVSQVNYGDYLYQHGLVDYQQKLNFDREEEAIKLLINKKMFDGAIERLGQLILSPRGNTYFNNATGFKQYYNFVKYRPLKEFWRTFINLKIVRDAIHVGQIPFSDGSSSSEHLLLDIPQSGKEIVEDILHNYKVLVYTGQEDIVCASPMMEAMLDSLSWTGANNFQQADRRIWTVGSDVAGYIRTYSNLTSVMVRNAGHMAAIDQPRWVYLLVKSFVTTTPLSVVEE